jgi:hypothetical protein
MRKMNLKSNIFTEDLESECLSDNYLYKYQRVKSMNEINDEYFLELIKQRS